MTPEQAEEQRISFAWGNAKLHDDSITREDVIRAAKALDEQIRAGLEAADRGETIDVGDWLRELQG